MRVAEGRQRDVARGEDRERNARIGQQSRKGLAASGEGDQNTVRPGPKRSGNRDRVRLRPGGRENRDRTCWSIRQHSRHATAKRPFSREVFAKTEHRAMAFVVVPLPHNRYADRVALARVLRCVVGA